MIIRMTEVEAIAFVMEIIGKKKKERERHVWYKRFRLLWCLISILFHQGNLRPEEALQSLTIYEGNFGRLKDEREKCARAKEALELTDTGLLSGSEERVQVMPAVIFNP